MQNYLNNEDTVFAFNIWNFETAKAVMDAAEEMRQNVILQTSESIYNNIERVELRDYVSSYSKGKNIKVWLHLDHCKNIQIIKDAILNGWDSVMIDASDKSIDKNIEITNEVVEYAHIYGVAVEAEIGQVKGIEDDIVILKESLADKSEILDFVKNAKMDMLAVSFGNAHGMYKGEPELDFDIVEYACKISNLPFVVHGGSGMSNDVLKRLASINNVKKINISTDVKLAYREGIMNSFNQGLLEYENFQAVNVEKNIYDCIKKMVKNKLQLLMK